MKRIYLFVLFATIILGAFDTSTVKLVIKEVDKKKQTLLLNPVKEKIEVGESGIVLSKIGRGIISSLITITEVDSTSIKASYERFRLLEQKYLPTPVIEPRVGDEVILRSFYSRAFIVAPNQELYEKIKTLFPKVTFVSSDLMIADVGDRGIVDPSKEGFQEMCKIYSVGILMIYASNGLNILDCQNFKVLQKQDLQNPNPKDARYPFFARVEAQSFWSFLKPKKEYFKVYDKLLE